LNEFLAGKKIGLGCVFMIKRKSYLVKPVYILSENKTYPEDHKALEEKCSGDFLPL
jgi:hypothetical protein